MISKMTLDSITVYIRNGFASLGIMSGEPFVLNGAVCVNCYGVHPIDALTAADRIAQEMGRKGWNVDVWFDEIENVLRVAQKESEDI